MSHRPALRLRGTALPIGHRTYVMAIINLTDDSFSGDGVGADVEAAVRLAVDATKAGADILDVGAESARADVPAREPAEEAAVLANAISRIVRETGAIVSADTYKPDVAEAALQAGARMVNDIGGLTDGAGTAEAAARHDAALVINFTRERPKVRPARPPEYGDLIEEHLAFLRGGASRAMAVGVSPQSLVIDPGIAFGKSHDEDLQVLRRLGEFRALGLPLLLAASRKHFIASATGLPVDARDTATAAITALAIAAGVDIVRVHDVRTTVEVARMADAIVRGAAGDFAATAESWPWAANAEPVAGTRIGETR